MCLTVDTNLILGFIFAGVAYAFYTLWQERLSMEHYVREESTPVYPKSHLHDRHCACSVALALKEKEVNELQRNIIELRYTIQRLKQAEDNPRSTDGIKQEVLGGYPGSFRKPPVL